MGLTKFERAQVKAIEFCANRVETTYYPLLAKRYKGLEKQKDLRYAPEGKRAFLDIIRKADDSEAAAERPLLFYIHGGGWASGLRRLRRFYCYHWADKGYICANVGYDYALDAKHPDHIKQLFKAMEYVLDRAEELGIDANRIVLGGESAGGHLAALMAAIATHPELYELIGIDFKYKSRFTPAACLLLSGIYEPFRAAETGFPFIWVYTRAFLGYSRKECEEADTAVLNRTCAPELYADSAFPPSFIIGSVKDKLLPESYSLRARLRAAGVPCELFVCKGINGMHAAALDTVHGKWGKECFEKAAEFMQTVFNK